eukprot:93756-Pyramimonas_sp.AAC.1
MTFPAHEQKLSVHFRLWDGHAAVPTGAGEPSQRNAESNSSALAGPRSPSVFQPERARRGRAQGSAARAG